MASKRNALTIVELLTVVSIVALLLALFLPAVHATREAVRRSNCQSNLRQIGLALQQHVDINRVFPEAARYPSVTPELPTLYGVLDDLVEEQQLVFECPSDSKYFAEEGTSYEYRSSRVAGKTRVQLAKRRDLDKTWVLYDFDHFHGPALSEGARNVLFADGHIERF